MTNATSDGREAAGGDSDPATDNVVNKLISQRQRKLREEGATSMRSLCVEKVKQRLYDPSLKFFDDGSRAVVTDWTNYLIRELQSLTLEQVEQKTNEYER